MEHLTAEPREWMTGEFTTNEYDWKGHDFQSCRQGRKENNAGFNR
jgi:hypothetical protein